ncbi:RNA polymerase sigma factor [Actinokineospora sp. HUAS TT18]|uniref:RNA polymerase sigma factor n=1 Tax=Actinokineospora sp. HUAS TT18 TaxID=3447451 RepID=UPI003F520979
MDISPRARARVGDHAAFGELYRECARAIYNHAFRLTGSWSVAEDVVALTFLEAWRLRWRVEPGIGSLRPWLFGIATNVVRNVTRAKRRHAAAMARLPAADDVPDFAEDVVDRVDDIERMARVHAAMATLRQAEREVFALAVWAGLDHAATAQALGVPVGTVKSRLSRARQKLREQLESMEPSTSYGQVQRNRDNAVRSIRESNR